MGPNITIYLSFILNVHAESLGKMIRNYRNLQGIKINNKECKLCQYADGTQIFSDGSENSLHQLMFAPIDVNIEKVL